MYKLLYNNSNKVFCFIFAILICFSFAGCDNSKDFSETTTIVDLKWEAVAEIQEWKTCEESGWEVPDTASVYKEQEEIKSYKIVGYKTKYRTEEYQEKIGYYLPTWRPRYETRTRQVPYQESIKEPIYATKYYYTIDKWVHSKNVIIDSGNDNNYKYQEYACKDNERINNVKYNYWVKFDLDGRNISYTVSKEVWETLKIGQEVSVFKNEFGAMHIDWNNFSNVKE